MRASITAEQMPTLAAATAPSPSTTTTTTGPLLLLRRPVPEPTEPLFTACEAGSSY